MNLSVKLQSPVGKSAGDFFLSNIKSFLCKDYLEQKGYEDIDGTVRGKTGKNLEVR